MFSKWPKCGCGLERGRATNYYRVLTYMKSEGEDRDKWLKFTELDEETIRAW